MASSWGKFLAPIVVGSTNKTFGFNDGSDKTASVTEQTYDTILELASALATAMTTASGSVTFTATVSSVGIVAISGSGSWSAYWGGSQSALYLALGYAGTETVSSTVLTATNGHQYGWYPGVSTYGTASGSGIVDDNLWQQDWPRSVTYSGAGNAAIVGPERPIYERSIGFDLIGLAETRDLDTGFAGFLKRSATKVFRWYEDRDTGTVAAPGTVGDPHDDETADYWEVSFANVPDWSRNRQSSKYYEISMDLRAEGQPAATATATTTYHLPLDYVQDWPSTYSDSLVFDWKSGDKTTATVYAGNPLTKESAPVDDKETPWIDSTGTGLVSTYFDGSDDAYYGTTSIDPAAGDDIVIMALVQAPITTPVGFDTTVATRRSDKGWRLGPDDQDGGSWRLDVEGNTTITQYIAYVPGEWAFLTAVIDADGTTMIYRNGVLEDNDATPAGTLGTGAGVGIGAGIDVTTGAFGEGYIHRVQVYTGTGLADTVDGDAVYDFFASVVGLAPITGSTIPTYARATPCTYLSTDTNRVWIYSKGMPRAGGSKGLHYEYQNTEKCYNNINMTVTTGYTASGGFTVSNSDAANLAAGSPDIQDLGPNVGRVNASGSDQYVRCGAVTGGTAAHSLSVYYRFATYAGNGAELGLYDGTTWTKAEGLDNSATYTYHKFAALTPANASQQWGLKVYDGNDIYFVGAHCVQDEIPGTVIPNTATAATLTRNEDTMTWTMPGNVYSGAITFDWTPDLWDDGDYTNDFRIISRDTTNFDLFKVDVSEGDLISDDGTNSNTVPITIGDGSTVSIEVSWSVDNNALKTTVGATTVSTSYDSNYGGAGDAEIAEISPGYRIADIKWLSGASS